MQIPIPPFAVRLIRRYPILLQLFWFGIGGIIGYLVDGGVLHIAITRFGFNRYTGRILSYLCAVTATFTFSRLVVFRHAEKRPLAAQWGHFALVNLIGFICNYGTYSFLVANLPIFYQHPATLGVAAGAIAGVLPNFFFSRTLVFRVS